MMDMKTETTKTGWLSALVAIVAPQLSDGFTVATRASDGTVTVGKTYATERTAWSQANRIGNAHAVNAYVATKRGAQVTIWNGPKSRLVRVSL